MTAPALSGWVFYACNLIVAAGYLAWAVLLVRLRPVRAWTAGVAFFLFCFLTHVQVAAHSWLNEPVIRADGTVGWWFLVAVGGQAASILVLTWALVSSRAASDES